DGAGDGRRHDEREGYPALEREDPAEDDGQLAGEQEAEEGRGLEGRQGEDERVGSTPVEVQDETDHPRHQKSFRRVTADSKAGLVVSRLRRRMVPRPSLCW